MSDIDDIKSRLNVVDIVGKHVTLKKTGRNLKGLCPFHNEKTPSFIVSPERESWHCFGCGKGGSIFDFIMEYEHVDFSEALAELADVAGITLTHKFGDTPEAKLKQKILEANHLASEYYQFILTKHALGENARKYLKNRGISDKSIVTFALGYSPNSWDALSSFLRKKGYDDHVLEQAGLTVRRASGGSYDRFRGRVMFALKDHRGNVLGFSGRVLDPEAKEAKYINTSETPVYVKGNVLYALDVTKAAIQKENEAIVMEGELDVISCFQEGISNVVAIKGSALTEGHVRLLKRYTERITFALDSDLAGDAAARRGIEIADRAGMDMRVVTMPSGKDPDEAARENAPALKKAIKDAVPIYDYFISSAMRRYDVATSFGKKKITDELLPILAKIENPIVQGHYIKDLARALDIGEDTVNEGLRKFLRQKITPRTTDTTVPSDKEVRSRQEKLEIYILALLLQGPTEHLLEDSKSRIETADITQITVKKVYETLLAWSAAHNPFILKDFADDLPPELAPTLDEAFLWDIGDLVDDQALLLKEWDGALREWHMAVLRRNIKDITGLLHHAAVEEAEEARLSGSLRAYTDKLKELEKAI